MQNKKQFNNHTRFSVKWPKEYEVKATGEKKTSWVEIGKMTIHSEAPLQDIAVSMELNHMPYIPIKAYPYPTATDNTNYPTQEAPQEQMPPAPQHNYAQQPNTPQGGPF